MSKTRKQTSTQKSESKSSQDIDPALRKEQEQLMELIKMMFTPKPINEQPTVAAFTPAQEAAFAMNNNAASAFGFDVPKDPMAGMPEAEESALGIKGYAPGKETSLAMEKLDPGYLKAMDAFYKQGSGQGGGKKKKSGSGGSSDDSSIGKQMMQSDNPILRFIGAASETTPSSGTGQRNQHRSKFSQFLGRGK